MSYISRESSINMWGVKLDIMFRGCRFFKSKLNMVLGSHNSPTLRNFPSSEFHSLTWVLVLLDYCQNAEVIHNWGVKLQYMGNVVLNYGLHLHLKK